jgi:DNA-binding transcriptional MerR regulator
MTERRSESQNPKRVRAAEIKAPGLVKLFYRIGEVATIVGVAPHVLRYWETEFPTIKPQKSSHGQRVYTKRDVQKLLLIKHLLKEQGLTIAGARKQLRAQGAGQRSGVKLSSPENVELDITRGGACRPGDEPSADTHEPTSPDSNPKALRQALLNVRQELITWLPDL